MKTILCPTDFSATAENAIRFALELNKTIKAEIVLFHAYVVPVTTAEVVVPIDFSIIKDLEMDLEKLKDKWLSEFPGQFITTKVTNCFSDISHEIQKVANEFEAELVIMGTKGASGLQELLIGSNAGNTIESINIPILTIPYLATFEGIRKVLFATNFERHDHENVEGAAFLSQFFGSELILLHVTPDLDKEPFKYNEVTQFTESIKKSTGYINIRSRIVENLDITEGIIHYAEEIKADIIGMTVRNRSFFERLFERSHTKQMAFHTHIPLLSFHHSK
jgi:nucleotide-binding universal stress UspA family protein